MGSIESGLLSQQFIKTAFGVSFIPGVLLNGLVLKAFHNPESIRLFLISSGDLPISKLINSSLSSISISIDKNFLLSPLLMFFTVPPAGDVKKIPIFFLSSKIF